MLLLTLDGKTYRLREENNLSGFPGEEITLGITVKGEERKQVSFTVTRGGFMSAQTSYDPKTRTGTFTIQLADPGRGPCILKNGRLSMVSCG